MLAWHPIVAVTELVAAAALGRVWTAAAGTGQTVVVTADGCLLAVSLPTQSG